MSHPWRPKTSWRLGHKDTRFYLWCEDCDWKRVTSMDPCAEVRECPICGQERGFTVKGQFIHTALLISREHRI